MCLLGLPAKAGITITIAYLCFLFKTPIVLNCTVCAADMNDTSKIVQLAEKCAILWNQAYDFHLEDDKTRRKKNP